jgi:hypothetical protein
MKRSASLCIVLVIACSAILAQTAKTPPASVTKPAVGPAFKTRRSNADEMREYKLRVLREHVLARVLDNIKKWMNPVCEYRREIRF